MKIRTIALFALLGSVAASSAAAQSAVNVLQRAPEKVRVDRIAAELRDAIIARHQSKGTVNASVAAEGSNNGAVVTVRQITRSGVIRDPVYAFITPGFVMTAADHVKSGVVPASIPVEYTVEGTLKVQAAGKHVFEVTIMPTDTTTEVECDTELKVDDKTVLRRKGEMSAFGPQVDSGLEVREALNFTQSGESRLTWRIACVNPRGLGSGSVESVAFQLKVQTPSDNAPAPIPAGMIVFNETPMTAALRKAAETPAVEGTLGTVTKAKPTAPSATINSLR